MQISTTVVMGSAAGGEPVPIPVPVLRLHGRVDSAASAAFERAVLDSLAQSNRLVLDFNQVEFVSSAGLRVVLLAAKQARAGGGGFAVFGLGDTVRQVFDISGFARVVRIAATEADAVAASA